MSTEGEKARTSGEGNNAPVLPTVNPAAPKPAESKKFSVPAAVYVM